jgi:hypothetical protein
MIQEFQRSYNCSAKLIPASLHHRWFEGCIVVARNGRPQKVDESREIRGDQSRVAGPQILWFSARGKPRADVA